MTLKKAYESSAKIFEQVSMRTNPALAEQLRGIKEGEIIVVRGVHDHVEVLLDTMKLPYTLIDTEDIKNQNGARIMLVNCSSYGSSGDSVPKKYLQDFVGDGGRLVTTDWALSVVTTAFPKRLHKVGKTNDDVVEIQCHTDIARRLVGLNYAQCHPKWWLESSSDVYSIENGVLPIITSEEMKEKYGEPYIAAGFSHGKGEVIHFISHLELQRTHLKTKEDKGTLDDFLKNMKVKKTVEMEDATVAELESAYSTLNTLAYLCAPTPILSTGMKSVLVNSIGGAKSKPLA